MTLESRIEELRDKVYDLEMENEVLREDLEGQDEDNI